MLYTITSPTGNSVTKELTADEVERIQALNYYTMHKEIDFEDREYFDLPEVESKQSNVRKVHISDSACHACEG